MRAVIDTNVAVSAALRGGTPPRAIVDAWLEGSFEAVTSVHLMAELERVFQRPHIVKQLEWSAVEIADFLGSLAENARVVHPTQPIHMIAADPPDNRVLEAAIEGQADYIVSGDQHLLALGSFEGIEIVSPARFAAILAATSSS